MCALASGCSLGQCSPCRSIDIWSLDPLQQLFSHYFLLDTTQYLWVYKCISYDDSCRWRWGIDLDETAISNRRLILIEWKIIWWLGFHRKPEIMQYGMWKLEVVSIPKHVHSSQLLSRTRVSSLKYQVLDMSVCWEAYKQYTTSCVMIC